MGWIILQVREIIPTFTTRTETKRAISRRIWPRKRITTWTYPPLYQYRAEMGLLSATWRTGAECGLRRRHTARHRCSRAEALGRYIIRHFRHRQLRQPAPQRGQFFLPLLDSSMFAPRHFFLPSLSHTRVTIVFKNTYTTYTTARLIDFQLVRSVGIV